MTLFPCTESKPTTTEELPAEQPSTVDTVKAESEPSPTPTVKTEVGPSAPQPPVGDATPAAGTAAESTAVPSAAATSSRPTSAAGPADSALALPVAVLVQPYIAPIAPPTAVLARPAPAVRGVPLLNHRQQVRFGGELHRLCLDGSLDKRFANNASYPKHGPYCFLAPVLAPPAVPAAAFTSGPRVRHNGPRCSNGSLDMRFKVNWGRDKYTA